MVFLESPHSLDLFPLFFFSPFNFISNTGKNTEVDSHSLLQGILLTQESNPGFLHYRQILYHLSRQGSPLEESVSVLIWLSLVIYKVL